MEINYLILLFISITLIFISLWLKAKNITIKKKYFAFTGKIVYEDLQKPSKSLYSNTLSLCGKPDYILKLKKNIVIPVEVKTGNHKQPKKHHIMQLIAYCQLVQETYHKSVPYGLLIYYDSKSQFKIPYDHNYKKALSATIDTMKKQVKNGNVLRNHTSLKKCLTCSMGNFCNQKLHQQK
jgi:CRISPR-associated protein Cas4